MNHIEQFVSDSMSHPFADFRPLNLNINPVADMATVVIGMRRTSKTFLLFQQIKKLIDNGVDPSTILYINLEDDRLHPCEPKILSYLWNAFFRLNSKTDLYVTASFVKVL